MKSKFIMVVGSAALALIAGCATTKSSSTASLENRVQALEGRVQVIESDLGSGAASSGSSAAQVLTSKPASGVTAETMTKKQIQEALKNAGYYEGTVDGKIGPKTRTAIMEFQKNMGLKADGIAGRNTKEKLLKYLQ